MAEFKNGLLVTNDYEQWKEQLQQIFITAFGSELRLNDETPQGQLIALIGELFNKNDEMLLFMQSNIDITKAYGSYLDNLAFTQGFTRIGALKATVDITINGVAGATVDENFIIANDSGTRYKCLGTHIIGANGVLNNIAFQSVEVGLNGSPANTITTITTPYIGVTNVSNPLSVNVGREVESDSDFRNRILLNRGLIKRDSVTAIYDRLLSLGSINKCLILENVESFNMLLNGLNVSSHSIAVIVQGGTTEEIVNVINDYKAVGCGTDGDVEFQFPNNKVLRFYRATEIPIEISVEISIGSNFPANGIQTIKERLVEYFNGDFTCCDDKFETDGIGIGEDVTISRLHTPINSVAGHNINTVKLSRDGNPLTEDDVVISALEIGTLDINDIGVSVI